MEGSPGGQRGGCPDGEGQPGGGNQEGCPVAVAREGRPTAAAKEGILAAATKEGCPAAARKGRPVAAYRAASPTAAWEAAARADLAALPWDPVAAVLDPPAAAIGRPVWRPGEGGEGRRWRVAVDVVDVGGCSPAMAPAVERGERGESLVL
ncbi:hypothetical protein GUJ93_ZPchr0010g9821 [Zizania palustris]|uniref:Uncharacterized protein n=1 Tax=Zizania palustris TaxID=103762 RepID=A0A8J5WFU6_ZIZPA|nr:hypothetical protein GUJ93_ZPchr0010g9821 [Zizania palustris]